MYARVLLRFAYSVKVHADLKTKHGSTLSTLAQNSLQSPLCNDILRTIEPMIITNLASMTRVDLTYILSAYCKAGIGSSQLYSEVIDRLLGKRSYLNAIDIANISLGLAKIGPAGERFLRKFEDAVISASDVRAKDLCLILYAYAKLKESPVFAHFEENVIRRKDEFDPQQVSMILNTYCKMMPNSTLFQKFEDLVARMNFDPRGQANVLHAYATVGRPSRIFSALAPHLQLSNMNTTELSLVLWSYHTIDPSHPVVSEVRKLLLSSPHLLDGNVVSMLIHFHQPQDRDTVLRTLCGLLEKQPRVRTEIASSPHYLIRTLHGLCKTEFSALGIALYREVKEPLESTLGLDDFAVLLVCLCKLNAPREVVEPFLKRLPSALPELSHKHVINIFYQLSRNHYDTLFPLPLHRQWFDNASVTESTEDSVTYQIDQVKKFLGRVTQQ